MLPPRIMTRLALFLTLCQGTQMLTFASNPMKRFVQMPRGGASRVRRRASVLEYTGQNDTQPFFVQHQVTVQGPQDFRPANQLRKKNSNFVPEVLSGMTVALASIPSSIAYSAIANLDPLVGIWSSVVMGAVTPLAGMRPGLISGAASVVAVPLATLFSTHGKNFMAPTILLAGVMEYIFSIAKGGKLINLVSDSVMSGFLNGLGFLLLKSQLKVFLSAGKLLPSAQLASTSFVVALTSALSLLLPEVLPGKGWPTALFAIVGSTVTAQVLNLPVSKLCLGGGGGSWFNLLPSFQGLARVVEPLMSMGALKLIVPTAFGIAFISILESLLAAKVLDEAAKETTGSVQDAPLDDDAKNKACKAMAVGNMASAMFGGFGGCGLIPQSLLNYQTGGRGVMSVLSYSAIMAASVLFFSSLIEKVPMASLAGVMILVALRTMELKPTLKAATRAWNSITGKGNKASNPQHLIKFAALSVSTLVCTVDMAMGIIIGVLVEKGLSALVASRNQKVLA